MLAPLHNETASSFAWRIARAHSMTLRQFASIALDLRSDQIQSDLDQVLPRSAAHALASMSGTSVNAIERLGVPPSLRCSSWNPSARTHTAQIFLCPECLNGGTGCARRSWRTNLAVACFEHGRYLVGGCSHCGEPLRFQMPVVGATFVPWLDAWSRCPACGKRILRGRRAPEPILRIAEMIETALGADPANTGPDPFSALVARIAARLALFPAILREFAQRAHLSTSANHAAIARGLLTDLALTFGATRDSVSPAVFSFLIGKRAAATELVDALLLRLGSVCA